MEFKLTSKYKPTGDQPEAIKELTDGIRRGDKSQVLLGVTGSGKTFTVANVIAKVRQDLYRGKRHSQRQQTDTHIKPQQDIGRPAL